MVNLNSLDVFGLCLDHTLSSASLSPIMVTSRVSTYNVGDNVM